MMPDQVVTARANADADVATAPAVSWAAIFAGGLTAFGATTLLVVIGAGLGFSAISPWAGHGVTATTFAVGAVIWLIIVQGLSSAVGGYVAGRLRANWTGYHRDEVFFRDTVHGLLAWALATMVGLALLGSAVGGIISSGARGVGAVSEGAVQTAAAALGPVSLYDIDTLMRPAEGTAAPGNAPATDVAPEVTRILTNGIAAGDVPQPDRVYLSQVVAARAGIAPDVARQRVDQAIERAKQAAVQAREIADAARKASARLALFIGLAMLIGAFVASAAAAYGGHLRDEPA